MLAIYPLNLLAWYYFSVYVYGCYRGSTLSTDLRGLITLKDHLESENIDSKEIKKNIKIYGKIFVGNSMFTIWLIILGAIISSGGITTFVFIKALRDFYS